MYRTTAIRDVPAAGARISFGSLLQGPLAMAVTDPRPMDIVDTHLPRCLRRPEVDFAKRIQDVYLDQGKSQWEGTSKGTDAAREDVALALSDNWDCKKWEQWLPGHSPKEHLDMLDRQWMIEREDKRDLEVREREDKRDARMRDRDETRHRHELLVFGGLIAVATIAGAFIQPLVDNWLNDDSAHRSSTR